MQNQRRASTSGGSDAGCPSRDVSSRSRPVTAAQRSSLVLSSSGATVVVMAVRKKRSISIPPDLDAQIASAAAQAGMSYSSWLAAAARKEFTIQAGLDAVSQFEREHGEFSSDELAEADQWAADALERAGQTNARPRRQSA